MLYQLMRISFRNIFPQCKMQDKITHFTDTRSSIWCSQLKAYFVHLEFCFSHRQRTITSWNEFINSQFHNNCTVPIQYPHNGLMHKSCNYFLLLRQRLYPIKSPHALITHKLSLYYPLSFSPLNLLQSFQLFHNNGRFFLPIRITPVEKRN